MAMAAMAAVTAAKAAWQAIVLAGFAYPLTGKLGLTLKERQATVSPVTAMATLVDAMHQEGANSASRDRTV